MENHLIKEQRMPEITGGIMTAPAMVWGWAN